MFFPREDDEWRYRPALGIHSLYNRNPFSATLLSLSRSSASFYTDYDHTDHNYTHQKSYLVKIIDIFRLDPIYRDYIRYKLKPYVIRDQIYVKYSLIIDSTI